ncbi:glycosyltransferase [Lactiplantibacillus plantarum]|nr:glycosyltransferase [Lactiplantibacillus plantarum]
MKTMSLVVPCYNEEPTIEIFYNTVEKVLADNPESFKDITTEYVFVNDGSSDDTLNVLRTLNAAHPDTVHYVSFSRNFGKEAGLLAGLEHTIGDYVAVMDVDLQDPPTLLPKMLAMLQTGDYDCIGTMRENRVGEPMIRSFLSRSFYSVVNKISKVQIIPNARDYRLMTRQMVDAILELPEYNRFSKGIFNWVGFRTTYLKFENQPRSAGETHWSIWQLFNYSMDAIVDFSDVPLKIATFTGGLLSLISIISIFVVIIRKILFDNSVSGWASTITITPLLGGIQLLCLGIIGNYICKI